MAIVGMVLATAIDEGNAATLEVEYDDSVMRLTAVRCNNNTSRSVVISVVKQSNGRLYNATFPPNSNTFISVPPNPSADRINVSLNPQGRLIGIEVMAFQFASS